MGEVATQHPRVLAQPEPGFFKLRLVRAGVFVPARIRRPCQCSLFRGIEHDWTDRCDRYRPLIATIGDRECSVDRVWTFGRFIDRDEYDYLMRLKEWAETEAPYLPEANPRKPVDMTELPSLF